MNDDTVVVMCFSVGVHDFVSKENRETHTVERAREDRHWSV